VSTEITAFKMHLFLNELPVGSVLFNTISTLNN